MSAQTAEQKPPLSFNFGMAAFQAVIANNFRSIQTTLAQQQAEIARLNTLLHGLEGNLAQALKTPADKESKESPAGSQIADSPVEDHAIMREKPSEQAQQGEKQAEKRAQKKKTTIQLADSCPAVGGREGESALLPTSNELNQTELCLSEVGVRASEVMEEKVFELFERVRLLEERQANSERFTLKRLREVDFQLEEGAQAAEKGRKGLEEFEDAVEALRNEVSEYKLKKESKILKALNSSALNATQHSSPENYDYMAEKLQFLLKHVSELLSRKSFEEEREALHLALASLRSKLNDCISEGFFQESLKALEGRVYQSVAKHLKALQFAPGGQEDQLDRLVEEGNREFTQRVSEHEQKLKIVSEEIALVKAAVEGGRKERLQFEEECSEQIRLAQEKCELLGAQLEDVLKYAQEARQSFGQKHLQSENQIIELQESLERVTANFKSLSFTAGSRDTPAKAISPNDNPESLLLLEKVSSNASNAELENDFKSQQKKFNKLLGKVQGLKEDILTFREDVMREVEVVKAGLEKKADWESLRKGVGFLEEKLRETKAVTQALYEGAGREEEGGSLAVKKGWTCLVCDKEIKSYEGKLGELKFTSLFPVRESPRIGGYYKQQQASQEYRQVFLSNSNLNNRSRRIASLKSKDSKEELH